MKDRNWDMFMAVLRAGLWEQDLTLGQVPEAAAWDAMRNLARQQAVGGLFYRGITHLPEHQLPPAGIRLQLMADADSIQRSHARVQRVQEKLSVRFEQASVPYIIQKGSEAGKYYPYPELRESGDIDLYCPFFEGAKALFPDAEAAPDGSLCFVRDGVSVELHPNYYDLSREQGLLPEVPSPIAERLMMSAHILKHAVGAGIGLKQLCDMARALNSPHDHNALQKAVHQAGIGRWYRLLCSFLVDDLGLEPTSCGKDFRPCNPKPLRRIIRRGGNMGWERRLRSATSHSGKWIRKGAVALSFLGSLPFSLRYAPHELVHTLRTLTKGNLGQ